MNIALSHNTTIKNLSRSQDKKVSLQSNSVLSKPIISEPDVGQKSKQLDWDIISGDFCAGLARLKPKSNDVTHQISCWIQESSAKTGALWVVFSLLVARLWNPHYVSELCSHRGNKLIASLGIVKVEWKQSNSQELGLSQMMRWWAQKDSLENANCQRKLFWPLQWSRGKSWSLTQSNTGFSGSCFIYTREKASRMRTLFSVACLGNAPKRFPIVSV